jgi:hypothetical protein
VLSFRRQQIEVRDKALKVELAVVYILPMTTSPGIGFAQLSQDLKDGWANRTRNALADFLQRFLECSGNVREC